jgi:hypothetical protein
MQQVAATRTSRRRALESLLGGRVAALVVAALALLAVFVPAAAVAKNRYALEPPEVERTAAFRYAELPQSECFRELDRRKVPYKRIAPVRQVDAPIRLTGPIHGVEFALTYRPGPDLPEPLAAILDCRLGIALDDLATVLAERDIVKVEYMSMYRRRGVGWIKPGRRHPAGLAIDVAVLHRKDEKVFSVLRDWHGYPGAKTCGEKAAKPRKDTEGARLLRDIVCELDRKKSFNLLLTPHYDWGHRDHFHMEVRQGIRWYLTQ